MGGKTRLWAVLVAVTLAWGCTEDSKPQARSRRQKARKSKTAKTAPTKTEFDPKVLFGAGSEDYSYNPVGKRDPFQQFAGRSVQGPDLPRSPLERFDLGQLVVTAIIWGISEPRALLRAPDGESYIVRKHMRIGKNRGRVSRITRRLLYVEEEYRDPTGRLIVRESSLRIRPKGGEKGSGRVQFIMDEEE